ncbi:MAG: hypothetical protein ACE37H_13750 [Phycisphaeraceae bacterium]
MVTTPGCGPYTHDDVMEDMLDVLEEMITVFKTVKDVDSARASGEKMQRVFDDFKAIIEKSRDLEKPNKEQESALAKKYDARFDELREQMQAEMKRIAGLGPQVQKAMRENAPEMNLDEIEQPDWMR